MEYEGTPQTELPPAWMKVGLMFWTVLGWIEVMKVYHISEGMVQFICDQEHSCSQLIITVRIDEAVLPRQLRFRLAMLKKLRALHVMVCGAM